MAGTSRRSLKERVLAVFGGKRPTRQTCQSCNDLLQEQRVDETGLPVPVASPNFIQSATLPSTSRPTRLTGVSMNQVKLTDKAIPQKSCSLGSFHLGTLSANLWPSGRFRETPVAHSELDRSTQMQKPTTESKNSSVRCKKKRMGGNTSVPNMSTEENCSAMDTLCFEENRSSQMFDSSVAILDGHSGSTTPLSSGKSCLDSAEENGGGQALPMTREIPARKISCEQRSVGIETDADCDKAEDPDAERRDLQLSQGAKTIIKTADAVIKICDSSVSITGRFKEVVVHLNETNVPRNVVAEVATSTDTCNPQHESSQPQHADNFVYKDRFIDVGVGTSLAESCSTGNVKAGCTKEVGSLSSEVPPETISRSKTCLPGSSVASLECLPFCAREMDNVDPKSDSNGQFGTVNEQRIPYGGDDNAGRILLGYSERDKCDETTSCEDTSQSVRKPQVQPVVPGDDDSLQDREIVAVPIAEKPECEGHSEGLDLDECEISPAADSSTIVDGCSPDSPLPESGALGKHDSSDVIAVDEKGMQQGDSSSSSGNLADECGLVDVYKLTRQVNLQTGKLNKLMDKYRSRTLKVQRLQQYLDQLSKEKEEMSRLLQGVNKETAALRLEAAEFRCTVSAVCDTAMAAIGSETEARRLEPTCYRRYTNIRTAADASNALAAVRSRIKALNELEVLVYRKLLMLNHILPSTHQDSVQPIKPALLGSKPLKSRKSAQTSQAQGSKNDVVIEVLSEPKFECLPRHCAHVEWENRLRNMYNRTVAAGPSCRRSRTRP